LRATIPTRVRHERAKSHYPAVYLVVVSAFCADRLFMTSNNFPGHANSNATFMVTSHKKPEVAHYVVGKRNKPSSHLVKLNRS